MFEINILKGQYVLQDFVTSWPLIVILLLISAVVSFIYIVILRWVVGKLILKKNIKF